MTCTDELIKACFHECKNLMVEKLNVRGVNFLGSYNNTRLVFTIVKICVVGYRK